LEARHITSDVALNYVEATKALKRE